MKRFANQFILFGGLATSVAALFLVYLIAGTGLNLMGLYLLYIVPVGAVLVGVASGIGYAVMSRWTNYRAGRLDFAIVLCVSLITYASSHYITYRHVLAENGMTTDDASFVDYMKLSTETAEMSLEHGRDSFTVGKFGYLLLLLETAGFCIGAVVPLVIVSQSAYCEDCGRYMTKKWEAWHNSEKTKADLKGKKQEKAAMIAAAAEEVLKRTFGPAEAGTASDAAGHAGDAATLERWRAEMSPTADTKALARLHVLVKHCQQCGRRHATLTLESLTVEKQAQTSELASVYLDAEPPADATS